MPGMITMTRRTILSLAAACAFTVSASQASAQQGYPDKPIRMIVPLSAASTVDIVARQLVDQMAPILGQNLIVDNKPGAGGTTGQSGEAHIFPIQDDNLTAGLPLRRSILRQKYRSTGKHNPQRDGGPEKGLYRLHPIALSL